MKKLVLLRHGLSQWNKENRFTGWVDVPLSDEGIVEAKNAAVLLHEGGYSFDVAFTSVLTVVRLRLEASSIRARA